MPGPSEMLLLAGLVLIAVLALGLALRPPRRELRLPREEEATLPDSPAAAPPTIDLSAREIDAERRPEGR